MSRKQYLLSKQLAVAATLALGASGVALADDSSMSVGASRMPTSPEPACRKQCTFGIPPDQSAWAIDR